MTRRPKFREMIREAMLDQEENLSDLRAALAALPLMASTPDGIEADDMAGLLFVTRRARALAGSLHRVWRDGLERLARQKGSERDSATGMAGGAPRAAKP